MTTQKPRVQMVRLWLSAVLLFMCGTASAQVTGGDWTIPTGFGEFIMSVSIDGTGIDSLKIKYVSYSCAPGVTESGTGYWKRSIPWPITDRQFAINLGPFQPGDPFLNINGTFAESGNEVSGDWTRGIYGWTCSDTFGPIINVSVDELAGEIPEGFTLAQNYPNPFNPETVIHFRLDRPAHVRLGVFNLLGAEVITLVDQHLEAGSHTARWRGIDGQRLPVASGVYLYRLEAGEFVEAKKMIFVK